VREAYWRDETAALFVGAARETLAEMHTGSAECIVAYPLPWTPRSEEQGEFGGGASPARYIAAMRGILGEAYRVLADRGTCWLAASDYYLGEEVAAGGIARGHRRTTRSLVIGRPAASLAGLPWQLASAMYDDGWNIANAIVWHRRGHDDPEDRRFRQSYETIFLLVKQAGYHFDAEAMEAAVAHGSREDDVSQSCPTTSCEGCCHRGRRGTDANDRHRLRSGNPDASGKRHGHTRGKIFEDVWELPVRHERHLPVAVPLRCIAVGCRPGGTVLELFTRSAATGIAARQLGRHFVGIAESVAVCGTVVDRLGGAGDR
jgi:site-specific DNA-methyltransferase (cytosine-N4-specific)